jgi:hypothetical protein
VRATIYLSHLLEPLPKDRAGKWLRETGITVFWGCGQMNKMVPPSTLGQHLWYLFWQCPDFRYLPSHHSLPQLSCPVNQLNPGSDYLCVVCCSETLTHFLLSWIVAGFMWGWSPVIPGTEWVWAWLFPAGQVGEAGCVLGRKAQGSPLVNVYQKHLFWSLFDVLLWESEFIMVLRKDSKGTVASWGIFGGGVRASSVRGSCIISNHFLAPRGLQSRE